MMINYYSKFLFLAVVFSVLFSLFSVGQESLPIQLDDYMKKVRAEKTSPPVPEGLYRNNQQEKMLNNLQFYYSDSVIDVRQKAYYITYRLGKENNEVSSAAVQKLMGGLKDHSSAIVGTVGDYLAQFHLSDFTRQAKDTLVALLKRGTPHYKKIIQLAGFVNPEGGKEFLKSKLQTKNYSDASERWTVLLALARMGDEEAIEKCQGIVSRMPVNDDFVYDIAPGLVYTRQKKLIEPLIEIIHSKEKKCHSSNPESETKIVCGYRLMEYLAPVINNFPLESDSAGEIETDDYKEALNITRNWFKERNGDYQLIKGTF